MDYCISTWDPRHHGAIEEPHHNTYDIEFWGPDGMHQFLCRCADRHYCHGKIHWRRHKRLPNLQSAWQAVARNGIVRRRVFIQKIRVDGLNASNPANAKSFGGEYSEEAKHC